MTETGDRSVAGLLDEFAAERLDAVLPKSGVIDRLLDLRIAAIADPIIVAAIDQRIPSVPGRTMTDAEWWRHEVAVLREFVDAGCEAEGAHG